jgi:hypothetical protein
VQHSRYWENYVALGKIAGSRLSEAAEKSQSHSWPPMNTDERRLKTIALSAFISVDRRLNLPFPDFFSSLFQAALSDMRESSIPASAG